MSCVLSPRVWLVALLLSAFFIAFPDEGTAATKRTGGVRPSYDLATMKGARVANPNPNPGNPPVVVGEVGFELDFAGIGAPAIPGGPLPSHPVLSIVDADSTGRGPAASLDVFYDGAAASFPTHSFYHLTLDVTAPGSTQGGINHWGDRVEDPSGKFWEAAANVQLPGTPELPLLFIGETNSDQPNLRFSNVQIVAAPVPGTSQLSSFFDVFFEIDLVGPGTIDPGQPIFWLTTGSQVPEPASLSVLAVAGALLSRRSRRSCT